MVDVASVAGRFGRLLHAAGLPVSADTSARLAAALALVPPATVRELYWLARVTMVSDHSQLAIFDQVFADAFGAAYDPAAWRGQSPPATQPAELSPARPSGEPGSTPPVRPPTRSWVGARRRSGS